jgi:hypothetical protein
MKHGASWWVVFALFVLCGNAMAVVAIEGTILIEPPPATLLRGQTATITYTVTNTGDEPLDYAVSGTEYWEEGPTSTVYPLPTAATPPCFVNFVDFSGPPGQSAYVVSTTFFRPELIPPGESRQCVMDLLVSPNAAGPFVQRFGFNGVRGTQIVRTSQEFAFNLGQGAIAVPFLGWPSGALLLVLLVFSAARSLRR